MAIISYVSTERLAQALQGAPSACVLVDPAGRLVCGESPLTPKLWFDFEAERFMPLADDDQHGQTATVTESSDQGRTTGVYRVRIRNQERAYKSLKALLRDTVLRFADEDPEFLQRLETQKPYTRRLVSRDKSRLFDSAHLAKDFSEKLTEGWWINTNNSAAQTRSWLIVIANVARLTWGREMESMF
jgi:hypothetical protein